MEQAAKSQTNSGQWVVKRLRQISGLSKREIARRAQTTPAALVEYESGRRSPSLSSLYRIADACGLEVQITFRRKNPALNREVCGERLAQVLALADALPKRPAAAQGDKAQYRIEP